MRDGRAILETERLWLRELVAQDAGALAQVLSDPEAMRFYPAPLNGVEVQEWIDRNRNRYVEDGYGLWALVHKATQELIGDCGLVRQLVEGAMEIEIGYHVRPDFCRQGLATEAARACRDYAFDHLGREQVISLIRPENVASRRVAEKNGMTVLKPILWKEIPHLVYRVTSTEREPKGSPQ